MEEQGGRVCDRPCWNAEGFSIVRDSHLTDLADRGGEDSVVGKPAYNDTHSLSSFRKHS